MQYEYLITKLSCVGIYAFDWEVTCFCTNLQSMMSQVTTAFDALMVSVERCISHFCEMCFEGKISGLFLQLFEIYDQVYFKFGNIST